MSETPTKEIVKGYRMFLVENDSGDLNKAEIALCINIVEWIKGENLMPGRNRPSKKKRDHKRIESFNKKKAMTPPPVDNDYVAEGCERFGFPKHPDGKPVLTKIKGDKP